MQRLFLFLYNNRTFFFFLLLEAMSGWLIIQNNQYQSTAFYNSSNAFSANILEFSNDISSYFNLKIANEDLALENAQLKSQIEKMKQASYLSSSDTLKPEVTNQYRFYKAKVINNSIRRANNFLTINKGLSDGLRPGMGVVGPKGIVGRVKVCSRNFSTVISLLHTDMQVSSQVKINGALCTTKWDGKDPEIGRLEYLPKHVKIQKGDTVISTGFSGVYPQGILIGIVENVTYKENETFVDAEIRLSTDFSTISYVYVVENKIKPELDSLEAKSRVYEQ